MTPLTGLITRVFLSLSVLLLTACGFGSSSSNQASIAAQEELFIDGGGIKGPLAFASVGLYALDTRFKQLYDSDAPLATATTNAYAQIKGLRVPKKVPAPYILVVDGTNAIDLNTNVAPVINKMITVITQRALDARQAVYATPYTTLVYQMLQREINSLDQQMAEYSEVVSKALGFGMPAEVDIFTTSPIITKATDSTEEQQLVINYRAAIEALSAMLHEASVASAGSVPSDKYLELLAIDLHNDGVVNDVFDGSLGESIDIGIFLQEPMDLLIPNTDYFVRDILSLLDTERSVVGGSSNVYIFSELLVVSLRPALLDSKKEYPADNVGSDNTDTGTELPVSNFASTLVASSLVASGPIVISGEQDVVISGLHITNANGSCIEIKNGASNITIENSEIGPCGNRGVDIADSSDIMIRNNRIHDTFHEAVISDRSHEIAIDSNIIENVESGYEGFSTSIGNLSFTNNYVRNVGRRQGSSNGGNIAMLAYVHGGGIRITGNIGINIMGESDPEDLINIYKSYGIPEDPILISGNKFKGGGPSNSGGGIILGDQGGSNQVAQDNILVNPGQYGIAIVGGQNNILRRNKVYSDDQRDFTNVGLVVYRFDHNGDGTAPGDCYNHTIELNEITFYKGPNYKNYGLSAYLDPYYNPSFGADKLAPNCGEVSGWSTNKLDTESSQPANLDGSIWSPAWDIP